MSMSHSSSSAAGSSCRNSCPVVILFKGSKILVNQLEALPAVLTAIASADDPAAVLASRPPPTTTSSGSQSVRSLDLFDIYSQKSDTADASTQASLSGHGGAAAFSRASCSTCELGVQTQTSLSCDGGFQSHVAPCSDSDVQTELGGLDLATLLDERSLLIEKYAAQTCMYEELARKVLPQLSSDDCVDAKVDGTSSRISSWADASADAAPDDATLVFAKKRRGKRK
eukprot:TRINITY_DN4400_c1_g1_i2.p1 TRINITY_DN4400_c1_g1~~TRINITY_DN4400_c1_g1_i2.p1  ORF type:complete len:259 (+),score=24.93 TRINITY_DN4400_c1_g1_i2:98-778(+)